MCVGFLNHKKHKKVFCDIYMSVYYTPQIGLCEFVTEQKAVVRQDRLEAIHSAAHSLYESCHTYECDMSHSCMRHVAHMKDSFTYRFEAISHAAHSLYESCHAYE